MSHQFVQFIRGESVRIALRYTTGAIIPLVVMMVLGYESLGIELMLGTILVSGADIKEPFRDKVRTLLGTGLLSFLLTIGVCLIAQSYWVLIPVLFVVIFLLSYVAPFGNRYASMAFMGNLAIIIALSTYKLYQDVSAVFTHGLIILAGITWYILYTLIIHYFSAKWLLIQLIVEGMQLTVAYLQQRVSLFQDKELLWQGLMVLSERQTELTNKHGELREFLLQNTSRLHRSGSFHRKMLLIFAELVDMLEAALATPIDYRRWRNWLQTYPVLQILPQISHFEIKELKRLTNLLLNKGRQRSSYQETILRKIEELKVILENFLKEAEQDPEKEKVYQHALRVSMYQEVQLRKLHSIEGIITGELNQTEHVLDEKAHHRFANARIITWNSIRENFTFKSSYFRYALRTSVTAISGFMLGIILGLQNAYWVLLTVLVVMKPDYAVTRLRFIHRIIGTVVGAAIAYGLFLMEPSHLISLGIFGISLFIAFSFLPYIYAVSTVFFTIYIVFLYSFLHKEIPSMVIYRVADTALGAVLCFVALHYLWPSWEHESILYYIRRSLESNKALFFRILKNIHSKDLDMTEYRLARKSAYINMANLVSSFQRFKSEPEKKQKAYIAYGDILLLNYTILSTISSIGVYVNRHPALLPALDALQVKFMEVNSILEEVLGIIYRQSQAPSAGVVREELNPNNMPLEWSANAITHQKTSGDADVEYIMEQLEQLKALVLRLKEQIQKGNTDASTVEPETVMP